MKNKDYKFSDIQIAAVESLLDYYKKGITSKEFYCILCKQFYNEPGTFIYCANCPWVVITGATCNNHPIWFFNIGNGSISEFRKKNKRSLMKTIRMWQLKRWLKRMRANRS